MSSNEERDVADGANKKSSDTPRARGNFFKDYKDSMGHTFNSYTSGIFKFIFKVFTPGETFKVVFQALMIALVIRTFFFQPFNIPSGSLIPTLLVGDYLFVSKYAYGYSNHTFPFSPALFSGRVLASEPKRGDIAVFKLPKDGKTDYIKRVIGLPGDRIQLIDSVVHINGIPVKRALIGQFTTQDAWGQDIKVPEFRETLPNGVSYTVIQRDKDRGYWSNTYVYQVPAGHYFMMGDNRDNSTDSRDEASVGFVPYENFVGRAEVIFFSTDVWKSVRWNRIFKAIK